MPDFTYLPGPEDDETTRALGYSFAAGEWTAVPEHDQHAIGKLRGNPFFRERDPANGSIPLSGSYPNATAGNVTARQESGSELPAGMNTNESASEPVGTSTNVNTREAPEQYARAREPQAIDITPQQCRAARAWLEWSREQLAKAAKIGERTIIDFERGASKMLPANKTALRNAFEAAGLAFDVNGLWAGRDGGR